MADTDRKKASVILRETAVQEQTVELAKNEFREISAEYGATKVPEEIDGALSERTKMRVMNQFTEENPYKNPDGEM